MAMNAEPGRDFFEKLAVPESVQTGDLKFQRTLNPEECQMTYEKYVINETSNDTVAAAQFNRALPVETESNNKSELI